MWKVAARGGFAVLLVGAVLLVQQGAWAAVVLNPANPIAGFRKIGNENHAPAPSGLTLTDTSIGDFVAFFADENDALPGIAIDVVATFQILNTTPNNADTGVRIIINEGGGVGPKSVVLGAIIKATDDDPSNPVRGLGLAAGTDFSDPSNWPAFVPVDWTNMTSVRLRRTANGDAELVEVNGAAPLNPVFLPQAALPPFSRFGSSIDFGTFSVEAHATVVFTELYSELVTDQVEAVPEPTTLLIFTSGLAFLGLTQRKRRRRAL
jgi:hypothetical protein